MTNKNYTMTTEDKVKQQYPDRIFPKRTLDEVEAELLKEKGITEYEHLEGTTEGDILPGGVDEVSGTILAKDGKIYHYWLDWDPEKIAPDGSKGYYALGENFKDPVTGELYPLFKEVSPERYQKYQDDPSFIAAKKRLGLK